MHIKHTFFKKIVPLIKVIPNKNKSSINKNTRPMTSSGKFCNNNKATTLSTVMREPLLTK